MGERSVCFVAFTEQDNIGVGYIASVLMEHGYRPVIIDFRLEKEAVLDKIRAENPLAVGFSVVFQYHIYAFRDLIEYLREQAVTCHFCAGGHYPSLRYRDLLSIVPGLDSVVLFEGENTLLELIRLIEAGEEWRSVEGIAYRANGAAFANPLRPLESELDNFPPPVRALASDYILGKKYATLLAGRGCLYDCSFCSIREFYSKPPGALKRVRRPEMVVREMELLHTQRDCSVFMFQDDDFPVSSNRGSEWATEFCRQLAAKGLGDRILWKISCRSDEVEAGLFERMRDTGLFLVYLGIESGTDESLALMNKHMKPERSVRAVETLDRLGICWDFGFMLLDPSSTWSSVRANLDFLERICAGGSSPVTFCKMLPYAETKIEADLRRQGRLKGIPGFEDYDFLDPSLDRFFAFLADCFGDWIGGQDGVLNYARWAHYYPHVCGRFFAATPGLASFERAIIALTAESNVFLLARIREMASMFERDGHAAESLRDAKADIAAGHSRFRAEFKRLIIEMKDAAASLPRL